MSGLAPRPTTRWIAVVVVFLLSACEDGLAPSRVQVSIIAEPPEANAVPMTGVNAGNVECRYSVRARAEGGYMSEVEWLDARFTTQFSHDTTTTPVTEEEVASFWSARTSFEAQTEWGWAGPADLVPASINNVFYFRRLRDPSRDSVSYQFVCR